MCLPGLCVGLRGGRRHQRWRELLESAGRWGRELGSGMASGRVSASLPSRRDGIPSSIAIRGKYRDYWIQFFCGVSLFLANSSRIKTFLEIL